MHTLRKILYTSIALALLAVAADVSIFHRPDIKKYLQSVAILYPRFFELATALLSGMALLTLLVILRRRTELHRSSDTFGQLRTLTTGTNLRIGLN